MIGPNPEIPKGSENPVPPPTPEQSSGEKFSHNLGNINKVIEKMLKEKLINSTELELAWAIRADIAGEFIDSLNPTPENPLIRQWAQFDIIVDKARIFERLGDTLHYLMELDEAVGFGREEKLGGEEVDELSEEIDSKVDELDDSLDALIIKLRGHVRFSRRALLRLKIGEGIEREDLLKHIRFAIIKEDGNPDEVFAAIGLSL